jgi:glycosyltransferase involved in cell wall biosynthesis
MAGAAAGQTVRLAVVIPTRNRAELAINALRSVLAESSPAVHVVVSDNSTALEEAEKLSRFCTELGADQVRYIRPPHPQGMSDHWQWALEQARGQSESTHFTYLTDRMVFRPGARHRGSVP